MATVARINRNGEFLLADEIQERAPAVTSGLSAFLPFDNSLGIYRRYPTLPLIRYVRDWVNGSTANTANLWVEIEVYNTAGANIAPSSTVSSSAAPTTGTPAMLTNGDRGTQYINIPPQGSPAWVQLDLGYPTAVSRINVLHYHADGRTYHGTKTEVSLNGTEWFTVFDSAIDGKYAETAAGHDVWVGERGPILQSNITLGDAGLTVSSASHALNYDPSLVKLTDGTFSVWFTPDAAFLGANSYHRVIGHHGSTTNKSEIQVMRAAATMNLCFSISNEAGGPNAGNWADLTHPTTLVAGTLYHVVARWNSAAGTYALFINGEKVEKAWDTALYMPTVLGTLAVGYHPLVSTRRGYGTYSDAAIYNRALTDAEVQALYKARAGMTVTPSGAARIRVYKELPPDTVSHDAARDLAFSPANILKADFSDWLTNGQVTGGTFNTTQDFFGTQVPVWESSNQSSFLAYSPFAPVRPDIPYQFSVWIYRAIKRAGRLYVGMIGSPSNVYPATSFAADNNPYFWYKLAVTEDAYIPTGQWFQVRGYVVPETWTQAECEYLAGGWLTSEHQEADLPLRGGSMVFRLPSTTTTARIRLLDYQNTSTYPSTVYWALPTISPLVPARSAKSGLHAYKLKEAQIL